MQRPQLRQRQLITTFGPGAMTDLPERSVLIAGLDAWVGNSGVINEPRLTKKVAAILKVDTVELRRPPEAEEDGGGFVRSYIFPLWFVTQDLVPSQPSSPPVPPLPGWRTRHLVHWSSTEKKGRKFRKPDGVLSSLTPVRFVRACPLGHLGDIDWLSFVHGKQGVCIAPELFLDERGTSGDLGETWVRCACQQERPISQAADPKSGALGLCDGGRPWLGQGKVASEKCNKPNRLLVRAASNAWLPQVLRVISLPQRDVKAREAVDSVWPFVEAATGIDELVIFRKLPTVSAALQGFTNDEVFEAIQARKGPGSEDKPVKRVELETLVSSNLGDNKGDSVFYARELPRPEWDKPWMHGIERVLLVERLREVAALVGFTRFEAASPDAETGDLDAGVQRADIARQHEWVPAVENRGEGIFIQFRASELSTWFAKEAVHQRYARLKAGFALWKKEHPTSGRRLPSPEYVFIHSLSHLLITAISLECGYPASSLMERIYAVPQVGFGLLIYTASSDAEGTLGGLVQAGRRIAHFVRVALELGSLCSNDPVCGQHDPQNPLEGRMLHGAACHGCVLIAETSCEQTNDFLDRALVARTVAAVGTEFFSQAPAGALV